MWSERKVAMVLALFLVAAGPASAARKGRLIGKVLDPEGEPIAGVTVTTTAKEFLDVEMVTTTDKKGLFKVDFEHLDTDYVYRFEKAGFQTLTVEQHWTVEGTDRHQFTLTPMEMATPIGTGDAPPASTSAPALLAYNEGVRAFKAKDSETARAKFEEAIEHDPNLRQAWEALCVLHLEEGRYAEAVDTAEKALALGSTSESVLQARWEAYRHLGDTAKAERAREELERFGKLTEEAKRIHNEGVALARDGDEQAAFARFKEAVSIDPNLVPAQLAVATTALKIGRPAEAAEAAAAILKGDPQNGEALKVRYNAALALGDEAMVVDALVGLAAVDPKMVEGSLFQLALNAFDRDESAKAKELFQKVLAFNPNHARAHYQLGLILMREGANKEARSHLERFLALAPNDPDAGTAKQIIKILGKP